MSGSLYHEFTESEIAKAEEGMFEPITADQWRDAVSEVERERSFVPVRLGESFWAEVRAGMEAYMKEVEERKRVRPVPWDDLAFPGVSVDLDSFRGVSGSATPLFQGIEALKRETNSWPDVRPDLFIFEGHDPRQKYRLRRSWFHR